MNKISIKRINEINFKQINNSILFNSPRWLRVLKETYNFPIFVLQNLENNINIPICIINNEYEKTIKSLPFSDYVIELENNQEEIINNVIIFLKDKYPRYQIIIKGVYNNTIKRINIKNTTIRKTGVLYQIEFNNIRKNRQGNNAYGRNIRKAIQNNIVVKPNNTIKALKIFYELHLLLRINKFQKIPQPFSFFQNIFNEFIKDGKGIIFEAIYNDIVIASWIILENNNCLYYKFGASDAKYLLYRPNDLLFRKLVEYGQENKYEKIDLGYSGITKSYTGLRRFKKKEGNIINIINEIIYTPEDYNYIGIEEKNKELKKIVKEIIKKNNITEIQEISKKLYCFFA